MEIYIPPGPRLGSVVIQAENVSKAYGANLLFEGMSFSLPAGGIVGIIGPNGAGKTTLFRMITGQEQPDSGSIRTGETVKLAYVDQERDSLDPDRTIWEVISGGRDTVRLGSREVNSRAYVARFNFAGTDQQKKVSMISGGERNRVHLACMLKEGANVLLLDEPTNDLDVNTMRALEERWRTLGAVPWSSATTAVPLPHRPPHPGLREVEQHGGVVRRATTRLRGRPEEAALKAADSPPDKVPYS
jgi:ATPase subunit of ABC transporter with duplicated ATPase domains